MSLHKFAEQVASQGRGDDSLLVHMTPDEVRNLQQFAQANGTTLTINPTTGLPEAGLLSDLFKSIAPIALGAFLGPAGAAIGGGFMSAGMAGLATGGITALGRVVTIRWCWLKRRSGATSSCFKVSRSNAYGNIDCWI